jgi:hypothetical protein
LLRGLGAVVVALGIALPFGLLQVGTQKARACIASYEAPRGASLPDCRQEVRWFVMPSRVPWTATTARYRAEELGARSAIAAYDNALVGHPDPEAVRRAAFGVEVWAKTLRDGSTRLALEELGVTVGAPDLGQKAALGGDRVTLLTRFERWDSWNVRQRALEAALTEGDLPRASAIAKRYAAFDPRDEDLRSAVAATLCLGEDPQRGIELFTSIQDDRARQQHESWARNWGELRAALVACAARVGVTPPPKPKPGDGGRGDAEEARAALRLRLMTRPAGKLVPADPSAAHDAVLGALELLSAPCAPGSRVRLLAAILASKHELAPGEIAEAATPKKDFGEAPILGAPHAVTVLDWLEVRRALSPVVESSVLKDAVEKLKALAASARLPPEQAGALRAAAGAAAIEAARTFADAGDGASAIEALSAGGDLALPSAEARALGRSSAWYIAGDAARALGELDPVVATLAALPSTPVAAEADAPKIRAAALIQRAELLASLGRREEAAQAALIAAEAALASEHRGLSVRARWTRLALGAPGEAGPNAPADAPSRAPGDRSWPWVGAIGTPESWLSPDAEGPARFDRALAFWDSARTASPSVRRALRYAAFAHRGDLPNAPVAYFALAAELLGPGEGDVELWLDVFSAIDSHRLPLRTYTWLRAEAARLRGDAAHAAIWAERHRTLAALVADPGRAEIARYLGL